MGKELPAIVRHGKAQDSRDAPRLGLGKGEVPHHHVPVGVDDSDLLPPLVGHVEARAVRGVMHLPLVSLDGNFLDQLVPPPVEDEELLVARDIDLIPRLRGMGHRDGEGRYHPSRDDQRLFHGSSS